MEDQTYTQKLKLAQLLLLGRVYMEVADPR